MTWVGLLATLLKLVASLADWLRQRQLLQAGEALALAKGVSATLLAVEEARHARSALADPVERDRVRAKFTRAADDRSGGDRTRDGEQ